MLYSCLYAFHFVFFLFFYISGYQFSQYNIFYNSCLLVCVSVSVVVHIFLWLWMYAVGTTLQPFYGSLDFGTTPLTPMVVINHPYLLHLLWSMASSLFSLRAWQSFFTISLQVFFGLLLGLAPSTLYCIHFFTQSSSSFRSTCPYHCNLFCCSTEIMSSNPSLSLNPLLGTLFCSLMLHMHLTILISARWSATSFSFFMDHVSLPFNVLLLTQLLYNLPLTINDISLLVSSSTICLNIFHQFEFWSPQLHRPLHLHSTCHVNNKTYPLTSDLHPVPVTGFTQPLQTNGISCLLWSSCSCCAILSVCIVCVF